MKIGNHTIGNREIIGRKNKLMRPSLIRIEVPIEDTDDSKPLITVVPTA